MKRCTRCALERPLEDFYAHPHTADGRQSQCAECQRETVSINREARRRRLAETVREHRRRRLEAPGLSP